MKNGTIESATSAVKTAETSRAQVNVDAARILVAALPDRRNKSELMKRLDAIRVKAENNQSQNPVSKINNAGGNRTNQTMGNTDNLD